MKKTPKNPKKFECKKCAFISCNKKDYTRHLSTAKHINRTELNTFTPKNPKNIFCCEFCDKTFSARNSLWYHKKKCNIDNQSVKSIDDVVDEETNTTDTMMELIKQNQEFKELIVEQNKQLIEIAQKPTTTNNTINNNQKFNLQVFLNEQCKDAINMSDFLANMTLDMEDLTETGRLGYVGGISRILVNKLQELDIYKRPLHCTDLKRETLYIRDNDVWEKENNSKETMKKLVNKVANKNCKTMRQWTQEHPNYTEMDTPENQEFMKLSDAVLGGFGEQESKLFRDKVIRSVIKEVMVNKNI